MATGIRRKAGRPPKTYVDATGVGAPIVDLLQEFAPEVRSIVPVYFTYGDRHDGDYADGIVQVKLGMSIAVIN